MRQLPLRTATATAVRTALTLTDRRLVGTHHADCDCGLTPRRSVCGRTRVLCAFNQHRGLWLCRHTVVHGCCNSLNPVLPAHTRQSASSERRVQDLQTSGPDAVSAASRARRVCKSTIKQAAASPGRQIHALRLSLLQPTALGLTGNTIGRGDSAASYLLHRRRFSSTR